MDAKYSGGPNQKRSGPQPDALGQVVNDVLQEFIVVSSFGVWVLFKSFFSRWFPLSLSATLGLLYYSYEIATKGQHIIWLHLQDPRLLTMARLGWMYRIPVLYHWIFLYCLFMTPCCVSLPEA